MNLKILIVEDEKKSQKLLKHFLDSYCKGTHIIGIADGIKEANAILEVNAPDLIFLDIELSDGNGFDFLEKMIKKDFLLVFVTGYDQFGIKAIKHDAFDYILKPFSISEIVDVVEKAKKRLTHHQLIYTLENSNSVNIQNLSDDKLALKTATGTKVIQPQSIEYISVDEPYCRIHLIDKTIMMVHNSLKGLVPYLPDYLFRINRSFIVNLNLVAKWDKGRGGNLETQSGIILPISYRLKKSFVEVMKLRTELMKSKK